MTKNIDARLLAPGQLFTDPLGLTDGAFKASTVFVENTYPHADGTPVPAVTIDAVRYDDDRTPIKLVLDLGTEVHVVPPKPAVYTSYDTASATWAILIDTADCGGEVGDVNLNVALNDATLWDGDPEAEDTAWAKAGDFLRDSVEPDGADFEDDSEGNSNLAAAWAERAFKLEELLRNVTGFTFTPPPAPKVGDRVRLEGRTQILKFDVTGKTGTLTSEPGRVALDEDIEGTRFVLVETHQITKL